MERDVGATTQVSANAFPAELPHSCRASQDKLTSCMLHCSELLAREAGSAALNLLQPIHGCAQKLSSTFLRLLAVGILGLQPSNGSSKQAASVSGRSAQAVRAQLLQLVQEILG